MNGGVAGGVVAASWLSVVAAIAWWRSKANSFWTRGEDAIFLFGLYAMAFVVLAALVWGGAVVVMAVWGAVRT